MTKIKQVIHTACTYFFRSNKDKKRKIMTEDLLSITKEIRKYENKNQVKYNEKFIIEQEQRLERLSKRKNMTTTTDIKR